MKSKSKARMPPVTQLWWLSYAKSSVFQGVVLIRATDFFDALRQVKKRKLAIKGACIGWPIADAPDLKRHIGKRLDRATALKLGAQTVDKEMDAIGLMENPDDSD